MKVFSGPPGRSSNHCPDASGGVWGPRRCSNAPAVDIEGKAVVNAHQPALVIDPIVEGRSAMGTAFLEQAHLTSGVPEGHQLFAQEFDPHLRAIGIWELRGQQERVPIAPEQLTHGRVRARPTYQLIVFTAQHTTRFFKK